MNELTCKIQIWKTHWPTECTLHVFRCFRRRIRNGIIAICKHRHIGWFDAYRMTRAMGSIACDECEHAIEWMDSPHLTSSERDMPMHKIKAFLWDSSFNLLIESSSTVRNIPAALCLYCHGLKIHLLFCSCNRYSVSL